MVRWSQRRSRRRVRRGLTRFEARLRSSCPGIGYTARITAMVLTEPPFPDTDTEIVSAVRTVLRMAAEDVSKTCDPTDPATARDIVGAHLYQRRQLPTDPPVEFRARLALELLPDDSAAVQTLLAAQRTQAVADILRRQKVDAVTAELADPAALLVRWAEGEGGDWATADTVIPQATKLAQVFANYQPEHGRSLEYEALEVLREFLASFPDQAQKLMLYTLLAAGMNGAQRPHHAAKVQALLNGHAASDTASTE
jgi:hypothetical protein